jgi:hypothetical protein
MAGAGQQEAQQEALGELEVEAAQQDAPMEPDGRGAQEEARGALV